MKELLESGVHFGHQTKRWNPKMKEYIFGQRNGIYIIDLQKTLKLFQHASQFITEAVSNGQHVLFVGTKRQAQEAILEETEKCGMYCVTQRWLGGLLTNFATVRNSIQKLRDMDKQAEEGYLDRLTKKERSAFERERHKREKIFSGVKNMPDLPGALFVVDIRKEKIAVNEARKLNIPVIAIVDTNCDPDRVSHIIPGNDDAIRAIKLFASKVAEAVLEGRRIFEEKNEERQRQIDLEKLEQEKRKEEAAFQEAASRKPKVQERSAAPARKKPAAAMPPKDKITKADGPQQDAKKIVKKDTPKKSPAKDKTGDLKEKKPAAETASGKSQEPSPRGRKTTKSSQESAGKTEKKE